MSKPILGYWDIRGVVEPIRFLYHYLGVDFEDKRYIFGPPPAYEREEWLNDKFNLDLDFPNLPYLLDGNFKLTQSTTIIRYVADKYNMSGNTEEEKVRVSLAEQQVYDYREQMITLLYLMPNNEAQKVTYLENLPKSLELLSKFLGDRHFVAGDKVTYVDFMLYHYLDVQRLYVETALGKFNNLKEFLVRIENIPTIAKYMKSEDYPRTRIWRTCAGWEGPES